MHKRIKLIIFGMVNTLSVTSSCASLLVTVSGFELITRVYNLPSFESCKTGKSYALARFLFFAILSGFFDDFYDRSISNNFP